MAEANQKRVLFLDVDGVLNSIETMATGECIRPGGGCVGMAQRLVAHLKRIVEISNCDVVISSTWRLGGVENGSEFEKELTRYPEGVPVFRRVIGKTVNGFSHFEEEEAREFYAGRSMRGAEIQEWLGRHQEVTRFAIVDDSSDMGDLMPYLFRTTGDFGLTEEIADQIIAHLTAEEVAPC